MKREALEHPKLHQLAADLVAHVRAPERWSLLIATGLLERVWGFAGKQKVPDGAFDQASIAHLARAVGWPGRPDSMRDSLVRCKFFDLGLEGRFIIHGWSEHCDRWVHRRLVRLGKPFADGMLPNAGYADTKDRRQPEEEPSGQPAAQPGGRPHASSLGPLPEEKKKDSVPSERREQRPPSPDDPAPSAPSVETEQREQRGQPKPEAPSRPEHPSPQDVIWRDGVQILTAAGVSESSARSFLGRLCRTYTKRPEIVFEAVTAAIVEKPVEPRAWLEKSCRARAERAPNGNGNGSHGRGAPRGQRASSTTPGSTPVDWSAERDDTEALGAGKRDA